MEIISVDVTDSTNSLVKELAKRGSGECLVYAIEQTAGRGQRGNKWESEPGKNLTASMLLFPKDILPSEQFVISEAVALGVVDILGEMGIDARVKWPNDIYVGDRKISGILIEHAVMGRSIMHTVAGIGLNLNQSKFISDAPNPVSVVQLNGKECDVSKAAVSLAEAVKRRIPLDKMEMRLLHEEFLSKLWRGDGNLHPFLDKNSGKRFRGKIMDVGLDGLLRVMDDEDTLHDYAFKEVEFLLD
ncbi:MAG: biotin--[acetyl-CoA-carboxylase] ligase [Muribaculaceae bacterium]|nr:biotin--[acetyl-CoA-carboxylase] ligase [Muribaculaceae bacterium]